MLIYRKGLILWGMSESQRSRRRRAEQHGEEVRKEGRKEGRKGWQMSILGRGNHIVFWSFLDGFGLPNLCACLASHNVWHSLWLVCKTYKKLNRGRKIEGEDD